MLIPEKLKIGGHEYKIQFHKEGELCADKGDCGIASKKKGIIEISDDLIESEKIATLFHEIFHIINSELDHALLDSLAQQWHQVMHDNNLLRK